MFNGKRLLAIIPARGGSKRLPGKNTAKLGGKPLISWTIDAAHLVPEIDEIIVSTEDPKIAEIAQDYGANVPFVRPMFLSTDNARSVDVVTHALNYFSKIKQPFDYVILLQPTSPFRDSRDIRNAIIRLGDEGVNAVVSVSRLTQSPDWFKRVNQDLTIEPYFQMDKNPVMGDSVDPIFMLNGAIYVVAVDCIPASSSGGLLPKQGVHAYEMPSERSVDIDYQQDLDFVRFLLRRKGNLE